MYHDGGGISVGVHHVGWYIMREQHVSRGSGTSWGWHISGGGVAHPWGVDLVLTSLMAGRQGFHLERELKHKGLVAPETTGCWGQF